MKKKLLKMIFNGIFFTVSFLLFSGEYPKILVSTFPIYQFSRNIVDGSGVNLDLLLPPGLGCPHDYALTPQDMMKISNA
ncbi:MAG TPA: zinc ABC transporter substrate-binding protein, partial [Victivallales bacterium]|nr:zinc ABC transporter substrate-binding protein [Victivallales bacterium]